MEWTQGKPGRVFVLRLKGGDRLPDCIEEFCRAQGILRASVVLLGGADRGSRIVAGPEDGRAKAIVPLIHEIADIHEFAGVGTVFPDEKGNPVLHAHAALGRAGKAAAGCVRAGVKTWLVAEAVIHEIVDCTAVRRKDPASGFELLEMK